jgi:hypothetical protein
MKKFLISILLIISIISSFHAQTLNGKIFGENNQILPFVSVKLISIDTLETISDFDGKFSFTNIKPDTYTIVSEYVDHINDTSLITIKPNTTDTSLITLRCIKSNCDVPTGNNGIINMEEITVKEFIDALRVDEKIKNRIYILYTTGQVNPDWINRSDIEYLMGLIYSKQNARIIFPGHISMVPRGQTTIGEHAINLIETYRLKHYFSTMEIVCPKYDNQKRKELRKWWKLEKDK